MQVSGLMQIGEGAVYAGLIQRRLIGFPWHLVGIYVITVSAAVIGGLLEALVRRASGAAPGFALGPFFGLVLGYLISLRFCRWYSVRAYRRSLTARGFPKEWRPSISLNEHGVRWEDEGSSALYRWGSLSELVETRPYWIFIIGANGVFVPRRLFGDRAAESAFVATALERMNAPAQARSTKAQQFVARV